MPGRARPVATDATSLVGWVICRVTDPQPFFVRRATPRTVEGTFLGTGVASKTYLKSLPIGTGTLVAVRPPTANEVVYMDGENLRIEDVTAPEDGSSLPMCTLYGVTGAVRWSWQALFDQGVLGDARTCDELEEDEEVVSTSDEESPPEPQPSGDAKVGEQGMMACKLLISTTRSDECRRELIKALIRALSVAETGMQLMPPEVLEFFATKGAWERPEAELQSFLAAALEELLHGLGSDAETIFSADNTFTVQLPTLRRS